MKTSTKKIHALYNDDEVLLHAIKEIREKNYKIDEVFTPFPVHGLEKALGVPHTRLAYAAFIYGFIGLIFSIWMMNYIMIVDWPQNIGGKPNFSYYQNMPAFVPIMFEMTVFFAAHLMVITFYYRSRLWPFKEAENPDPRTTDDMFLVELSVEDEAEALKAFLNKTGAVEIKLIEN